MSRSEGTGDGQARRAAKEKGYWAEIYERYHKEVRARFVGRVRCSHDVDDLVQNVFASLIMHGNNLQNPQAYVRAAARHQLWTYWRRHRRADLVIDRAVLARWHEYQVCSSRGDPDLDPLGRVEKVEQLQAVNAMVNRLSPVLAETLKLRFIEGMPPAEMAARLHCSRQALKKRLTRAKRSSAQAAGAGRID